MTPTMDILRGRSGAGPDASLPRSGAGPDASPWLDIGPVDAVPMLGSRIVRTAMGCIAVFRTGQSEAYAIDDACPHKAGPLSQGIVHGTSVTCPLHNWVIDLKTGAALGADEGCVRTFALKIENGRMLLDGTSLRP